MKTRKGCWIGLAIFLLLIAAILLVGRGLLAKPQGGGPSLRILSPAPGAILTAQVPTTVQLAATARRSPVAMLQFYEDGFLRGEQRGAGDTLLASWQWAPFRAGEHRLTFLAYDQKGNITLSSLDITALPTPDRDADGVADSQDACPDEAGPLSNNGCPLTADRDRDGIADDRDTCPDEAGGEASDGCPPERIPDRDRDGLPDDVDRCPDQPGPPEWEGCPLGAWITDRDGDGNPDFLDVCPEDSGPLESDGCPSVAPMDSDGDGVNDEEDACDDRPGPPETDGCPLSGDRDGDGVPDDRDRCPDTPGPIPYDGCLPDGWDTDSDGDGVMDFADRCDDEPGPAENMGCPLPADRDGDGVPDAEDACPDRAGLEERAGCPNILIPLLPGAERVANLCELVPSFCDADGDGLIGSADDCPDQAGPPENGGCPLAPHDRDGDGVLDEYDHCPDQAGDPAALGCPDEQDRDRDGVPLAYDACPEQAGPVANHGCPRPGQSVDVEIELLALRTGVGWSGVYCYTSLPGYQRLHVPHEGGYLGSLGVDSWSLSGNSSITVSVAEDSLLAFDVICWGVSDNPMVMPQQLGMVARQHGYADWDNQLRFARGEWPGAWFEVVYHLCLRSCP